jgi:hypothetical protein
MNFSNYFSYKSFFMSSFIIFFGAQLYYDDLLIRKQGKCLSMPLKYGKEKVSLSKY